MLKDLQSPTWPQTIRGNFCYYKQDRESALTTGHNGGNLCSDRRACWLRQSIWTTARHFCSKTPIVWSNNENTTDVLSADLTLPVSASLSQVKLNRMSISLRNARGQISVLHGRLEGLNLLNIDNVRAMVKTQVENITSAVNKLSSTCNTACPVQNSPQCKLIFQCFLPLYCFSRILF